MMDKVWGMSDEDGWEEKERKTVAEVDGQCECGLESNEDGCGGEEKERKTVAEVDGQCKYRLEREGTRIRKSGLCGANLSDTPTPHRRGEKMTVVKINLRNSVP